MYLIEYPNHDRNFDNKSQLKIQILDTNFNHYKLKFWKLRFNFKLNFTIDQLVAQSWLNLVWLSPSLLINCLY